MPYRVAQALAFLSAPVARSVRYGGEFAKTYRLLQESQWWPLNRIEEYQLQALQNMLMHCYENVPYYHQMFDRMGILPRNIQTLSDIRRLPLLTKEDVRTHQTHLCAKNLPASELHRVTTGGTTGMPLSLFYRKRIASTRDMAFVWRSWEWAGVSRRDRFLVLRGNRLRDGRWYEYDPIDRSLYLSSYMMTSENLARYIERIAEFGPAVIRAYPSSIHLLSRFVLSRRAKLDNVKCVLTSSETLSLDQRHSIEGALGARVYDHYGHVELCACIMQCERGRYHILPEYGYIELLDASGNPVEEKGASAEIVATGFLNDAMPLIRYRTGDIAVVDSQSCACGRRFPTVRAIQGRDQDFIVDRDGQCTTFTCSDEALWGIAVPITAYQYVQEEPGKLLLRVETSENLDAKTRELIANQFHAKFARFELSLECVAHIPRTERGKFRYLLQKIDIPTPPHASATPHAP